MAHQYTGSGKLKFGFCTGYFKKTNIYHKFNVGDLAWLKYKAKKGKLESVSIKNLIFSGGSYSANQMVVLYKDNYNFLYNPDELLTKNEAVEIAKAYLYEELADLVEAKKNCVITNHAVGKKNNQASGI